MQPPHADLDVALAFVVERITQEAERSSVPLDDDEQYLLNHLPTEPTNPTRNLGVQYGLRGFLADTRSSGLPVRETLQARKGRTFARSSNPSGRRA